jgi:hypothetical protein
MSASYQHLPLAQVQPGMVLASELLDTQGMVLLPEGTVLSQAMIASLPRHGVEMLPINRVDLNTVERDAEEAARQARIARLAVLFRHHDPDNDRDWSTSVLYKFIGDYRLNGEPGA